MKVTSSERKASATRLLQDLANMDTLELWHAYTKRQASSWSDYSKKQQGFPISREMPFSC